MIYKIGDIIEVDYHGRKNILIIHSLGRSNFRSLCVAEDKIIIDFGVWYNKVYSRYHIRKLIGNIYDGI